jgi:hypothetical protein
MNTDKILIWQKIFFILNVIVFILLPLSILFNAGLVLFGALVLWPVEACLHALLIFLGIILLFYFRDYKKSLSPNTPSKTRPGLLIFLIILNILVLTIGGLFTYLVTAILK